MKHKREYIYNFEHRKENNNKRHSRIFESMMLSKAFQSLSNKQKMLYLVAKLQFYKRKPFQDFPNISELSKEEIIYIPFSVGVKHGLYTKANSGRFYKDLKALEEHGFIETLSSGKPQKTKSIYKLSDKWQHWQG